MQDTGDYFQVSIVMVLKEKVINEKYKIKILALSAKCFKL